MAETTRTKRSPLGWVKKHKVLTAVLLVVVLVAVLVLRAVLGAKKAAGTTYQYVRTTILQKTSLTIRPASRRQTASRPTRSRP